MPSNYVLLNKVVLSANTASVTFSNIPQTGYTDLVLKVSARANRAAVSDGVNLSFNGTGGTVYSDIFLRGSGTAASMASDASAAVMYGGRTPAASATASTFGNIEYYIPNYTSANYKSVSMDSVTENNAAEAYAELVSGLFSNTSAITSITIADANSSTFAPYSTFYLYGVAAVGATPAIAPFATGGNIIANDGTYWYHAFLTSGTFTPQKSVSCSILQVAGGGGAGADGSSGQGAAGGAGGVLAFASESLTTTNYSVTVGAGGAGNRAGNSYLQGGDGTNSQFGSLTASVGGGGGGSAATGNGTPASALGRSGGSGGGGGGYVSTNNASGGAGTSGQGYAGGNGGNSAAGGGGGAGGVGGAGSAGVGGNGGLGVNTVTNWGTLSAALTATSTGHNGYLASGGAGWQGGSVSNGGGGDDSGSTATANAIANTGGGGGAYVGAGGSGIVIIRYAMV